MQEIGWAGLGVIPTFDARKLDSDVGRAMSRTGVSGGRIFGRSAGKSAGSTFGSVFRGTLGALGVFQLGSSALRFLGDSVEEGREAVKVAAQSRAVIKSTGGVAGVSAKHMAKYAGQLSRIAGIDDELIQASGNVLATFKNVRNEQGENNKIFDKGEKAVLNMSVALGKDLNSSALQVGKALNDPIAGLTALGRAGVQFSQDQKDAIKKMVETGDIVGAQKIELRELNEEFRGSAKSQRTEADRTRVAWGNFKEEIGTSLIPVLDDLSRVIRKKGIPDAKKFFGWVRDDGIPMAKDFAEFAGDAAEKTGNLIGWLDKLPKPAKVAGLVALVGGIGASKLRGGGGGALGTAGKVLGLAKPVPVFVTNQGFGGPGVAGGPKIPAILGGSLLSWLKPWTNVLGKVPKGGSLIPVGLNSSPGQDSPLKQLTGFGMSGSDDLDWTKHVKGLDEFKAAVHAEGIEWDKTRGKASDYFNTIILGPHEYHTQIKLDGLEAARAALLQLATEARSIHMDNRLDFGPSGSPTPPTTGGSHETNPGDPGSTGPSGRGPYIHIEKVETRDERTFIQSMNRRAGSDGVRR